MAKDDTNEPTDALDQIYLDGVAIQFYRGIGPNMQYIGPFSKMNLFIGPNNSGKSIVLNFIARSVNIFDKTTHALESPEIYRGAKTNNFVRAVGIDPSRYLLETPSTLHEIAESIININTEKNFVWISEHGELLNYTQRDFFTWANQFGDQAANSLLSSHNTSPRLWLQHLARKILSEQVLSEIRLIPAKRELGSTKEKFEDQSGKGLLDELAELQSPGHDAQEKKEIFENINNFVQQVTGKHEARIEVPHDRKHLLVHIDNKVLPLANLGTGIHEVVLIAAFCTIYQEQIICIEEPEIHLHPQLQRKLIRYLQGETVNQYFIATHSSVFIDTAGASIFRVENNGIQTYVTPVSDSRDIKKICDDLGCRASDILQTNFVVWVEGPSDRIYIKHWIAALDPELKEGGDYVIMFYAGSAISHVSFNDSDKKNVENLIDLLQLGQNAAIVLDRDRDGPDEELKPAASRIREELAENDSMMFWVTEGREIENYIDYDTLQEAIGEIHHRIYESPLFTGDTKYKNAFKFIRTEKKTKNTEEKTGDGPEIKEAGKVNLARKIVESEAVFRFDLREKIEELILRIRKANGLPQD